MTKIFLFFYCVLICKTPVNARSLVCNLSHDYDCVPGDPSGVSLYKSAKADFKQCPDTTHVCLENDSKTNVTSTSGVYLKDYGTLNVYTGGRLQLSGDAIFETTGRSYLSLKGALILDCKETCNMFIIKRSEMVNNGYLELKEKSDFRITTHSYVEISGNGRVLLNANSSVRMDEQCALTLPSLKLSQPIDTDEFNQELILLENSTLSLTYFSTFRLISGRAILNDNASLSISRQSSLEINGFIELSDFSEVRLQDRGKMEVGNVARSYANLNITPEHRLNYATIFVGSRVSLTVSSGCSLIVTAGSHCSVKKSIHVTMNTILEPNTKNEIFDCYSERRHLTSNALNLTSDGLQ